MKAAKATGVAHPAVDKPEETTVAAAIPAAVEEAVEAETEKFSITMMKPQAQAKAYAQFNAG